MSRSLVIVGLTVLAGACGGERGDIRTGASVRDSASVRIVTNAGPDRPLAATEVLRIGAVEAEPAYLFDAIRSVAVAVDGSIWVSDSDPAIRRYGAEGEYLNSAGGEGEGPGEAPRGFGDVWAGDGTVLTYGYSPLNLQLFRWSGEWIATRSLVDPTGVRPFPLAASTTGWFLRSEAIPQDRGPKVRASWTVWHGDPMDGSMDSIVTLPGHPQAERRGGGWGNGSYLDGFPSLEAAGDEFYYTDPLEYDVQVFDAAGTMTRRIRRDVDPTPMDAGMMDSVEEALERGWAETLNSPIDDASRTVMLRALEPARSPDHLPMIDLVLAAPDGTIWVRRADRHPDPAVFAVALAMGFIRTAWPEHWKADTVLDVFDPDGAYRGTVTFPPEFAPLEVTGERIYGTLIDELDVQYVVAYEISG